jgi:DNA-directed RNA polymerase specialized sigma24 family protein
MEIKLSADALDIILQKLDPNREKAGAEYNNLKESLQKRAKWLLDESGCFDVDVLELVDEAFNRTAQKLLKGEEIDSIGSYLAGVCRYLIMEYRRRPERQQHELDENKGAGLNFRCRRTS